MNRYKHKQIDVEDLNKQRQTQLRAITKITFDIDSFVCNRYAEKDIDDLKQIRSEEICILNEIELIINLAEKYSTVQKVQ